MNPQIAAGNYLVKPIPKAKKISFQPSDMKPNTLVFSQIMLKSGAGWQVFLKSDFYQHGYNQTVDGPGEIQMIAFLKVTAITKTSDNDFIIDIGEGTGKDFERNLAAQLKLTFSSASQNIPHPYTGDVLSISDYSANPAGADFLLKPTENAALKQAFADHDSVTIEVNNGILEQFVSLHIYYAGKLLTIMDTNAKEAVTINHSASDVYIAAVIRPKIQYFFEIGDPETDAKVKIIEEDV